MNESLSALPVPSDVGVLHVVVTGDAVAAVVWDRSLPGVKVAAGAARAFAHAERATDGVHPVADLAACAVLDVIAGRVPACVPVSPPGTAFQRGVWEALATVPAGQTVTYAQLARMVGAPAAVRAVASAVATNPVPLLIACHRVVPAGGGVGGYSGGPTVKERLLRIEQARRV